MTACYLYYYYVITTTTTLLLSLLIENLTSRSRKAIGSDHGDDRLFTTGLAYTAKNKNKHNTQINLYKLKLGEP